MTNFNVFLKLVSTIRLVEEEARKTNNLLQDSVNKANCLKNKFDSFV